MSNTCESTTLNSSPNAMLAAALKYAGMGWNVFPLAPRMKTPHRGSKGFHDATTNETSIRASWMARPDSNIGVSPNRRLLIVDVDPRNGGNESFAKLEILLGSLPSTPTVRTPGGGTHRYYECPEDQLSITKALAGFSGIDFQYHGCYVVAPPSIHPNGGTYEWESGLSPDEVDLAMIPASLVDLFAKPTKNVPAIVHAGPMAGVAKPPMLEPILDGCSFMRHCLDDAATLGEPDWYAMLSIAGVCKDGAQHAHKLSEPHPSYSKDETDKKLAQALNMPPRRCEYIASELGFAGCVRCPFAAADMKSPIALGHQKSEVVRLQTNYVFDVQTSRYFPVAHASLEPLHKQAFTDKFRHLRGLQSPLSAGQTDRERIAQGIDDGVDFRRQSAARAADGLIFAPFLSAPALC